MRLLRLCFRIILVVCEEIIVAIDGDPIIPEQPEQFEGYSFPEQPEEAEV